VATSNSKLIIAVLAWVIGTAALAGCDPKTADTLIGQAAKDASQLAGQAAASPSSSSSAQPKYYAFKTVDDPADTTFNQLLGISGKGIIAGYFGSGAAGHPNKGYRISERAISDFVNENFPGAVQTQVIAVNDEDLTVGFFSTMNNANNTNANAGFYRVDGSYHSVAFPTSDNANPSVNQLLGVNDSDEAVGFYTDAKGNNHGYEYSTKSHIFRTVSVSGEGATSVTAAGIDNRGDVVGFFTGTGGEQDAFLRTSGGKQTVLAYPGASMTQAFGVNDHGEVVGTYTTGSGNSALTYGFTWTAAGSFKTVSDPNGVGTTTVNGVNDEGDLVGFYTDAAGNTDGMLATPSSTPPSTTSSSPASPSSMPSASASATASASPSGMSGSMSGGSSSGTGELTLQQMPQGTVTLGQASDGTVQARVDVTGLTPGSEHLVEIDLPNSDVPAVEFNLLTADSAGAADTTLGSNVPLASVPTDGHVVIRLGVSTSDANRNAVAAEAIAETGALSGNIDDSQQLRLSGVDVNASGQDQGRLGGTATVSYDSAARTITVSLNATGLAPGAHTAQIDSGSCQAQGSTLDTPMDFQADSDGNIVNETRTVTGVSWFPASGGWYLNLHEGDSGSITANGGPALGFRPLLCANG
jgi:hypothetical protein